MSKLLLRQGIIYSGGRTWTSEHHVWLAMQRFEAAPLQLGYETALDTVRATLDRRNRLDEGIAVLGADSAYTPVVARLGCLRGVSTLTAFGLVSTE